MKDQIMNKKLIIMLNALVAIFMTSSITAKLPTIYTIIEEAESVVEKDIQYAIDDMYKEAVTALNKSPKELAQLIQEHETAISSAIQRGANDAEIGQLTAIKQLLEDKLAKAKSGTLTVQGLKEGLNGTTLVAILTALGLITSGGVIAGYLISKDNQPAQPLYDYKYLPK